jgi:hypothetical protein
MDMSKNLRTKIQLMLARYEKLGLMDSWLYGQLRIWSKDERWLKSTAETFAKVKNSEKIFDVVGQITKDEADHRLITAFAEYDTAIRLTDWAKNFFGEFSEPEYLPRKNKGQPDFKALSKGKIVPIETKTFKGVDDIESAKFNAKVIKKLRKEALPQLMSFYEETPFERGIIFIWTQQHVLADDVRYNSYLELERAIKSEIDGKDLAFDVQIIILFANPMDLWDFEVVGTMDNSAR